MPSNPLPASRGPARPRRRGPAALVLLAVVAALLALTAGPASAHDELVGTDPADGATVATLPAQVGTTWSEAPDSRFATITVVGPDGTHYEAGPATVEGERVVAPVRPGPAGRYEIGYRIVSDDGHPVTGAASFTATGASAGATGPATADPGATAGTPAPTAAPSNAASSTPAGDAGPGGGVWAIVLVAVLVVGGAVVLTLRRRT